MSEVQTLYDNWGNRASRKEPDCIANGERVYKVGGYSLTVPDSADEPAKVAHIYNRWGRDENPMPNLSFSDGEMRIPVEDFVDLILRRVPATELAEGLWHNDEVRDAFVECMICRYRGPVEDSDRRKVLDGLQTEIRAKAIDRAVERLNHAEENGRVASNRRRWEGLTMGHYETLYKNHKEALLLLRDRGMLTDEQYQQRVKYHTEPEALRKWFDGVADPVARESVGEQWRESRDYWRKRLEEFFAEPAQGIEAATAGETACGLDGNRESPVANGDAPNSCRSHPINTQGESAS